MGIAFFDFDGTISTRDSFLAFLRFAVGRAAYCWGLVQLSPHIARYYLGQCPNHRLKELFFSQYFRGMREADLLPIGEAFATAVLPGLCRPAMLARISRHLAQGDAVVVLTASAGIWLAGWCRAQGVELVGSTFEVQHGRYTGRLAGPNCYGERKKELVAARLAAGRYTATYGYGNGPEDAPFLSLLQHVEHLP